MIIIDVENALDEKRSKELAYSLNEMIRTVTKLLKTKIFDSRIPNGLHQLSIEFDNGNMFYILANYNQERISFEYGYSTVENPFKDIISLQEALNINKYVLDIEHNLERCLQKNTSYIIEGYYTEQPIDRKLPIFHENDMRARYKKPWDEQPQYVRAINVFVPVISNDDDFER